MSFDPKSKEHKAKLYKTLVAAAELVNEPFDQFLQTPFNPPWSLADNYRRNLQRGEYSAIRAKVLYDFLLNHHFNVAHLEAPEIFPQTPELRWREILDARATSDRLRIVLAKSQFGIVERESQLEAAGTTLKLGQPFLLELTSDIDGYAVALQGLRGQWHPIPLGQDGEVLAPVVVGKNLIPGRPDGRPDPLIEGHDEGRHEFVLITAQKPDVPVETKQLATWVADNPCLLHRTSVQFVK